MAALSSVNSIGSTDNILLEILRAPNHRYPGVIGADERSLQNFRAAFDDHVEDFEYLRGKEGSVKFLEENFKIKFINFIKENLTIRCSDGKIRFHSCAWDDKQVSPLDYLITNFSPALILLQHYPKLKDVQSTPGIYPLHLFLKNLEEGSWKNPKESSFDDIIGKIKNIFTILVFSKAPLHHDPLQEHIYRSRSTNIIYSPLYYLVNGFTNSPELRKTLCSTLVDLIYKERINDNVKLINSFLPQEMPTALFSIINEYLIDPQPPIQYPSLELINEPVENKSLLMMAVECLNTEAVRVLMVLGADPNKPAYHKELQQINNHSGSILELVRKLPERGAHKSYTPTHETIRELLETTVSCVNKPGLKKNISPTIISKNITPVIENIGPVIVRKESESRACVIL